MGHEYCLDALCLSDAPVSKDTHRDAGVSNWESQGKLSCNHIEINANPASWGRLRGGEVIQGGGVQRQGPLLLINFRANLTIIRH